MTWQLRIRHVSGYRYHRPVTSSYNEARITPLTTSVQRNLESRVELQPGGTAYRYVDYWGTVVHAFDIDVPHTELVVIGTSVVETSEPSETDDDIGWHVLAASADQQVEYVLPTTSVPHSVELAAIGASVRSADGPLASAAAAGTWIRSTMTYRPGSTSVSTSAVDALAAREGVCQDFVHVFLGVVRSLGIPARYVSGYLHPVREAKIGDVTSGQSHAWAEVWAGRWVPVDPTNAERPGLRHVVVGRGRDYRDVAPLRGIYSGGAAHALDVGVELARLA